MVETFLKPAGEKFVEELVYRFLLTRGDTLGGMMRNIAGFVGERKFIRSFLSILSIQGKKYLWLHRKSGSWIQESPDDAGIENELKGICWSNQSGNRTLLLNITVPIVRKNIDISLLNISSQDLNENKTSMRNCLNTPTLYLGLGELKGGIDPAGADEHWKTANSALERIRKSFSKHKIKPCTFFVGAAIETAMAKEIFQQLKQKKLSNAANLTDNKQLVSLCEWLVEI